MLPAKSIAGALYHKLQTQSSAPEDGRNYRPKHAELIVIINRICYCCIKLVVYIIASLEFAVCLHSRETDREEICSFIQEKCSQDLTNSTVHDPSRGANSYSTRQKMTRDLGCPKVYIYFLSSLPFVPILNQTNGVQDFPSYNYKIRFNIIPPFKTRSSK